MKKVFSIMLAISLIFSVMVIASAFEINKTNYEIEIMQEEENPVACFIETIDKNIYSGTYWEGEVFHIIPVPEEIDKLNTIVNTAVNSRTIYPTIIIDNVNVRNTEVVYSMAQREAGYKYLIDNQAELNIEAVGYTADKLAVFMNIGATEDDKANVINRSPVKAIVFYDGGILGSASELIYDGEELIEASRNDTRATATTLRGGNWVRRTSSSNWSTITVSAVRNWNASTNTGDIGFLTCGHGWTDGQNVYASDGTKVGVADVRHYGNMDVTFVELTNTNLNSHGYMKDGSRITRNGAVTNSDVGMSVEKYGARTGNTAGEVTVVGISGTWEGYYFSNLFLTSITTRSGDSGSPIITDENKIVGILKGARSSSPNNGASDPTYYECVVLPIQAVINNEDLRPCT